MKKSIFALSLLFASSASFGATAFSAGDVTERKSEASTYTYTVSDTARADRLFVKNDFDFTLSANVVLTADEDEDGRYMVVGTANTQGRNVYIGHSNGGSVNGCGDPLTAEEAKATDALSNALEERFTADPDNLTGCNTNPDGEGED